MKRAAELGRLTGLRYAGAVVRRGAQRCLDGVGGSSLEALLRLGISLAALP